MTWSTDISDWTSEVFGPPNEGSFYLAKARKECKELEEAIEQGKSPQEICIECADVVICLVGVCAYYGVDLARCVVTKLLINKSRKWRKTEDGTWQHVKGT